MKENKFLKLLKTLDKAELKQFQKYLKGLYGKQEKMIKLFEHLNKHTKKDYNAPQLADKYLEEKVFNAVQSHKTISNLFSNLFKSLEEFLRWQKINDKADSYTKDKLQIEIYRERKLNDWFYGKIEKTKEKVKKAPLDIWHHLKLMELSHFAYFNTSTEKTSGGIEGLENLLNHLDLFFLTSKLKYTSEVKNRTHILSKTELDIWLLNKLLEGYQKIENTDFFSDIYLNLFKLQHSRIDKNYTKTKELFLKQLSSFALEEQLFILNHLLNYNISKARTNGISVKEELVELYEIGIAKQILISKLEGIELVQFFNVLIAGCRFISISWAECFYKKNIKFLNREELKDGNLLAQSIIEFEKKNFNKVLIFLRNLNFKNVFFSLRIRMLKLKCLIELKEAPNLIIDECFSFEQFIRRDIILNEQTKSAYENFISFIRKYFYNPKFDKEKLIHLIVNYDFFVQREWIKNMINSKRRFP